MPRRTFLPSDFRDFLAITSFLGLFGTFLLFVFGNTLISDNINALFLIVSGGGLMVAGKVFQIPELLKDGLQKNEVTLVLSVVIGKRFDSCVRRVRKKIKNKEIKPTFRCDAKGKPNKRGKKRCKTNVFAICSKLR